MTANTLIVDITISPEEYLKHYQGQVTQVSCLSRDGKRVRFPTKILQPFVSHEGIQGSFKIRFDAEHKFIGIERLV